MTTDGFIKQCTEYFGDWKRWTIGLQVKAWAGSRSQSFLDAMWALVRDNREVNDGPPDVAFLQRHVDDAARSMKRYTPPPLALPDDSPAFGTVTWEDINSWPRVEDTAGDRWLSRREAGEALALVYARMSKKGEV